MNGVKFGVKHSYDDFGLILSSKDIGSPSAQTNNVTIPMRDGSIDLTEALTGDVKYKDRKLTFTFSVIDPIKKWSSKISEIENYLHGQKMQIILDEDCSFYYVGRVSVNKFSSNKAVGTLVIDCTVDPYKYDLYSSLENWLWDSFSFETGCIQDASNISVVDSKEITIYGRRKMICPTITSSAAMTVAFEGNTYTVAEGSNKIYGLMIHEGENVLTFTGTGTVSVDYRGGSL